MSAVTEVGDAADVGSLRRVAGSGLWSVLAYGSEAGSMFLVSIVLARSLGPSGWGEYSFFFWILTILPAFLALGVPFALPKVVGEKLSEGDTGYVRGLAVFLLRAQVVMLVLPAVAVTLAMRSSRGVLFPIVLVLGIATVLASLDAEAMLTGLRQFRALAVVTILQSAGQLVVAFGGLVLGFGWKEYLGSYLVVRAVSLVLALGVCRRTMPDAQTARLPRASAMQFSKLTVLFACWVLAQQVLWGRPELLFLSRYGSARDLGYYSVALRISSLAMILPLVAARPLLPEFSRLFALGDRERVRSLYRGACVLLNTTAAPLALIGAALAPAVVKLVYGSAFAPAGTTAAILMGSSLVTALAGPVSAVLLMAPKPRFAMLLGIGGVIGNVLLDVVLIPPFGRTGAAAANVVAQGAWVLIGIGYAWRQLGLTYPIVALARVVMLAAGAAAVAGGLATAIGGVAGVLAGSIGGLAIYAGMVRLTRTVGADELASVGVPFRARSMPVT